MKPLSKPMIIAWWVASLIIVASLVLLLVFARVLLPASAFLGYLAFLFLFLFINVFARQRVRRILERVERLFEKEPNDDPKEPARWVP